MSQFDRKDFLKLSITLVSTACFAEACSEDDPIPPGNTGGAPATGGVTATGGTDTGGVTATGGVSTGGVTATGGSGGSGPGGAGAGGAGAGGAGAGGAGAGGASGAGGAGGAGAGGASGGGAGGASGAGGAGGKGGMSGSGGKGGMSGAGGSGKGGMCMQGNFGITGGMTNGHDHIPLTTAPNDTATIVAGINAGTGFTFVLPMDNTHDHDLVFTAGELQMLLNGMTLTKASTRGNHVHTYMIECAA